MSRHMYEKVQDVDDGVKGTPESFLDVQFTVRTEDGNLRFYFYRDEGISWKEATHDSD